MVPALTAQAATAAKPVKRLGFIYLPNGAVDAVLDARSARGPLELSPSAEPARGPPRPDRRPVAPRPRAGRAARRRQRRALARHGDVAETACIRSTPKAPTSAPASPPTRWPPPPSAARRRSRRSSSPSTSGGLPGRQLRERLQLRLHEHPVVAHGGGGDDAPAGGEQPARRLRAAVRRRRHPRRAAGGDAHRSEHPRLRGRRPRAPRARPGQGRPPPPRPVTSTPCAPSSGASSSPRSPGRGHRAAGEPAAAGRHPPTRTRSTSR